MCAALERRARPLNPHHCLHQTPLMKARCVSVSPAMMTCPALVSPCRLIRQVIKTGAGHVIKTGALTPWVGTAVRLRLHSVWRSDRRECARHQACRNTWSHFKCFGRSNCLLGIIGNATGQSVTLSQTQARGALWHMLSGEDVHPSRCSHEGTAPVYDGFQDRHRANPFSSLRQHRCGMVQEGLRHWLAEASAPYASKGSPRSRCGFGGGCARAATGI